MKAKISLLWLSLLFFTGCAIHHPTSELIAFRRPPVVDTLAAKKKLGLTVSRAYHDNEAVLAHRVSKYSVPEEWVTRPDNRHQVGVGLFFPKTDPLSRYAFSFTIGLGILGLDATLSPNNRDYFTASGSLLGGWQLILQRRVTPPGKDGILLGLTLKRTYHMFTSYRHDNENILLTLGPNDSIYLTSMGARLMAITGRSISSNNTIAKFGKWRAVA